MEDLFWVAGFLEGEGSFRCKPTLTVCASQVQLWPLEKLQSLFGGGISSNGTKRQVENGHQLCHMWHLSGYRAAALSMTLYSLMSPRRQQQIATALEFWKPLKLANYLRQTCPQGHPYRRLPGGQRRRYCVQCSNALRNQRTAAKREAMHNGQRI
jgi:hypothetical protein